MQTESYDRNHERTTLFQCRSKILTSNIPNFGSEQIKAVRVLKGGRAFKFREFEIPEGQLILQSALNAAETDIETLLESDSYLVLV